VFRAYNLELTSMTSCGSSCDVELFDVYLAVFLCKSGINLFCFRCYQIFYPGDCVDFRISCWFYSALIAGV
jgi:hypothetical protein